MTALHNTKPFLVLCLIILLTASGQVMGAEEPAEEPPEEAAEESVKRTGTLVLAADVFELNLDFDTTIDIFGETRFFSSRHNKYVGGRLMVHMAEDVNKTIYIAPFTGIVWGKSSFLMNWEEPGLLSFDPLESSVSTFSWPVGVDLNFNLGGFLRISPYASAKMMFLRMSMDVSDETYSDTAMKLGFDAGVKVSLGVGNFAITGGAGLTHILNGEIDFDLEDLKFESQTSGSSPEYFLGVEF